MNVRPRNSSTPRYTSTPRDGSTPRELGLAMPAESARHELTLMAWPARLDLWGEALPLAKADYATVARAIAGFEPVLMVAPEGGGREVRDACGEGVEVIELPIDDSWMRDSGPIIVTSPDGARGNCFVSGDRIELYFLVRFEAV